MSLRSFVFLIFLQPMPPTLECRGWPVLPHEELPIDSLEYYFGLSDLTGERILIIGGPGPTSPEGLSAISSEALCPLTFVKSQEGTDTDNGRQVARNFDNMPGSVLRSSKNCLPGDVTVFIVSKKFLETHKHLKPSHLPLQALDQPTIRRLEKAKGLKAKSGWVLADIGAAGRVVLVQFFPQGDTVLACLALVTNDRVVFEDYPGRANDQYSTWRVDDGGEFDPTAFKILAAFQSPSGVMLVRAWAGPEGENAVFLREDGSQFVEIATNYRYWVPE